MFSYHPDTSNVYVDWIYYKGFKRYQDDGDLDIISRAILKCVTSPIVWQQGRRLAKNFLWADWIVIDVDDGLSIEQARTKLKGLTQVIGTTKSHQITKDGVKCDRFRVWLKLDSRCEDLEEYSATVRKWARLLRGDEQGVDGARKFKPCNRIVSQSSGDSIQIQPADPKPKLVTAVDTNRYIPHFVKDLFKNGPTGQGRQGSRNYACYRIGEYLSRNGFGVEEIVAMIMDSSVPAHAGCTAEVRKAVQNGARRR